MCTHYLRGLSSFRAKLAEYPADALISGAFLVEFENNQFYHSKEYLILLSSVKTQDFILNLVKTRLDFVDGAIWRGNELHIFLGQWCRAGQYQFFESIPIPIPIPSKY